MKKVVKRRLFDKKRLAAFLVAGAIAATTLTGCRKSILSGTILKDTSVITFADGTTDIVFQEGTMRKMSPSVAYPDKWYPIYTSIVSGARMVDSNVFDVTDAAEARVNTYDIVSVNNIVGYLTDEELEKAYNGELTDEDVMNIITRVAGLDCENQNRSR